MEHNLKTWPKYYKDVESGSKPFEIRKDDRNYQVGDILNLQEYDPCISEYTGSNIKRLVTYTLRDKPFVPDGYIVMGLNVVKD